MSKAEIERVLDVLADHPLHPVVALALATGMRRGELLGLQWGDVDLDTATLRVERSVEETRAGLRIKSPKTKQGRRNVSLTADAVSMLRAHKVRQLERRLLLGVGNITAETLVFSTAEEGVMSPDNLSRDWARTVRRLKLPPVSFHALRHTHASMLLRNGVDVFTVSRRLGHKKPSVTLDRYGHLIEGADKAAAKAIEGVLK